MSLGKRLIDLAKANLNALLDKAGAPADTTIDQLTDDELEAELRRRRERRLREADEVQIRTQAEKAARERAAQRKTMPRKPPSSSSTSSKRPPPRPAPPGSDKHLRELYAQLETPYGAPFEDVKKSFRRLMRKYHPDLHVGNPMKHKTATQLTMSLTQAYNELEQRLAGGRAK